MNTLLDTLDSREKSLDYVIGKINRSRKKIPEGRIRICSSHGRTQYYLLKDSNDKVGEYIKKKLHLKRNASENSERTFRATKWRTFMTKLANTARN